MRFRHGIAEPGAGIVRGGCLEQRPRYLIRDNESKYGHAFTRVAETRGIALLRAAYRSPKQNAMCER